MLTNHISSSSSSDLFNDHDFFFSPSHFLTEQTPFGWDASYGTSFDHLPLSSPELTICSAPNLTLSSSSNSIPSIPSVSSFPLIERPSVSPRGSSAFKRQAISTQPKGNPEDEEELKRKRLARKAELARVGRKRKKDRIAELERQVSSSQIELELERKRNETKLASSPAVANASVMHGSSKGRSVVSAAAKTGAPNPHDLGDLLQSFAKSARQEQEVDNLQSSIRPCLFIRFLQWMLTQNDNFYSNSTSLWFSLFLHEVGVSVTQFEQLFALHKECVQLSTLALTGSDAIGQAFESLRQSLRLSTHILETFMKILTPPQLIIFFRWVGEVCGKIVF